MTDIKLKIVEILRECDCLMIPVKDKQLKEQLMAVLHQTEEPTCPACDGEDMEHCCEPKQCPECGHKVSEHGGKGCLHGWGQGVDNFCDCDKTPADLQSKAYPPQMPLIEVIDRLGLNIAHEQSCRCRVCKRLRKQRDADMAWHKQDRVGLVEVLVKAHNEIERLAMVTGYEDEAHFEVLRLIDAAIGRE